MDAQREDCRGLSDVELAAGALEGRASAWDELVRRHTRRVVVALLARGIPLSVAEDLAQDAWMRLVQQQRAGRLTALTFPGLAIAQAIWLAREAERTRARREGIAGALRPLGAGKEVEDEDPSVDPERQAIAREQLEIVMREIDRCAPRAGEVFRAVYGSVTGLRNHAEVARELGLSVQRVRQILYEIRARVRRALSRLEGGMTTMGHPSRETIAAFVMGIPTAADASLRRHLEHCPECARLLEGEARLEESLQVAARASVERVRPIRAHRAGHRSRLLRVAVVLALTALAVWAVAARRGDRSGTSSPALVTQSPAEAAADRARYASTQNLLMRQAPGYLVVSPASICRDPSDTNPYGPPW